MKSGMAGGNNPTPNKARVVVVGGGIGGSILVKSLQHVANIVLIDPKEYFEITWANLRPKVDPAFGERILIRHVDYLTNGEVIVARAKEVSETQVVTDDGRAVPYDYLVIATGHSEDLPNNIPDRLRQFKADNEKIESATSVLIVGGGPSGVELAGEIASSYPEKKVTLAHKGPRLLEFIGTKASKKALNWLNSKNVEVLLNQKVDLQPLREGAAQTTTSAGKTIQADCPFVCIGSAVGSAWLKETFLSKSLDENGRLMVDTNLRIKGCKNIFAIGDITDVPELKQGYLAQGHAKLVAKNLKLLMQGIEEGKLGSYKPGPAMAIVSLGKRDAVAEFPIITIGGRFPGMIKSKDLFVSRVRGEIGVAP